MSGWIDLIRLSNRFWSKVDDSSENGCWPWTGGTSPKGYGRFYIEGRQYQAHRVAYELLAGPIPDGLVIDHLCRRPACCNPFHMEPVSNRENVLRGDTFCARNHAKTHCPKGHPYSGDNLNVRGRDRRCRICERDSKLAWHKKDAARRRARREAAA